MKRHCFWKKIENWSKLLPTENPCVSTHSSFCDKFPRSWLSVFALPRRKNKTCEAMRQLRPSHSCCGFCAHPALPHLPPKLDSVSPVLKNLPRPHWRLSGALQRQHSASLVPNRATWSCLSLSVCPLICFHLNVMEYFVLVCKFSSDMRTHQRMLPF